MKMMQTACVLIINDQGMPLLINHRHSQAVFLPGGKFEPNEDAPACALREVCEKTGLVLDPECLTMIYRAECQSDEGAPASDMTTYVCYQWKGSHGCGETDIISFWGTWGDLWHGSPFSKYNRLMINLGLSPNLYLQLEWTTTMNRMVENLSKANL